MWRREKMAQSSLRGTNTESFRDEWYPCVESLEFFGYFV